MKSRKILTIALIFTLMTITKVSHGEKIEKIAIVPFKVFGSYESQYLKDAIPEMLFSRLSLPNKELVSKESLKNTLKDIDTKDELKQGNYFLAKTDYTCLIMGSYTKVGDAFSLDIKVLKKGERDFKTFFVYYDKENKLFEGVTKVAEQIDSYLLSGKDGATKVPVTLTPVGDTVKGFKRQKIYEAKRPFYGLTYGNFYGTGEKLIAAIGYSFLYLYKINGEKLEALEELHLKGHEILSIDAGDFNQNGKDEIYLTAINLDDVITLVYEVDGSGKLQLIAKGDWYTKVINHPVKGKILIGQKMGTNDAFSGGIYIIELKAAGLVARAKLETTEDLNIYQFTPIKYRNGDAIAYFNDNDILRIIDYKGKVMERLKEPYNGTAAGVMKGFDDVNKEKKFTPIHGRIVRIEDGESDMLMTLKNEGSRLFLRSKKFDRGVLALLKFDTVNYREAFTSEVIDGYVTDFAADFDNNNIYVTVVTENKEGRIYLFKFQR